MPFHILIGLFRNISWRLKYGLIILVIPNLNIMTYKIKSLLYFSCFMLASLAYYLVDQHDEFQEQMANKSYVEADFHDADTLDEPKEDQEELQP